jgi:hypothetical protein
LLACSADFDYNIKIANLSDVPLKDAWYSDILTDLRKKHIENNLDSVICRTCLNEGGGELQILDR